jgi:hypothetical protein
MRRMRAHAAFAGASELLAALRLAGAVEQLPLLVLQQFSELCGSGGHARNAGEAPAIWRTLGVFLQYTYTLPRRLTM